jgi:hypothetical protein
MLNPAFIAIIITASTDAYQKEANKGMALTMLSVVTPLVLHEPTRVELPTSIRTHMTRWAHRNPELRNGVAIRARGLAPTIREGVRFGLRQGAFEFVNGRLECNIRVGPKPRSAARYIKSAALVGRWIARTGEGTTLAVFSVSP